MWYSETLIIVHKGNVHNCTKFIHENEKFAVDVKKNDGRNYQEVRKHNCANYAGLCRQLTCPESPRYHSNKYSLSKTKNGRIEIKVIYVASMLISLLFCSYQQEQIHAPFIPKV